MLTTGLLIIIALWVVILAHILMPNNFYGNCWDRVTQARWRSDRENLQMMLDNFRSFPEEWSVKRNSIAFPKEGAKKLYLNYDEKKGWEYTLPAFDDRARPLRGHFEAQFVDAIKLENDEREKKAMARMFYPDLEGPLRLK